MKISFIILSILLQVACIDTRIPQIPSADISITVLRDYEPEQCFADLVFDHDHPDNCDEGCCAWFYENCEVVYCNEDDDNCRWEKMIDTCDD